MAARSRCRSRKPLCWGCISRLVGPSKREAAGAQRDPAPEHGMESPRRLALEHRAAARSAAYGGAAAAEGPCSSRASCSVDSVSSPGDALELQQPASISSRAQHRSTMQHAITVLGVSASWRGRSPWRRAREIRSLIPRRRRDREHRQHHCERLAGLRRFRRFLQARACRWRHGAARAARLLRSHHRFLSTTWRSPIAPAATETGWLGGDRNQGAVSGHRSRPATRDANPVSSGDAFAPSAPGVRDHLQRSPSSPCAASAIIRARTWRRRLLGTKVDLAGALSPLEPASGDALMLPRRASGAPASRAHADARRDTGTALPPAAGTSPRDYAK